MLEPCFLDKVCHASHALSRRAARPRTAPFSPAPLLVSTLLPPLYLAPSFPFHSSSRQATAF